jgi:hypothetical protein
MKTLNNLHKALLAGIVVAAVGLAGCEADGSGVESGGIIDDGGNNGGLGPNDGSTPTTVLEDDDGDGVAETPVNGGKGFVCKVGANAYGTPTTKVGANGVVGGLLGGLSGDTLTRLLASVSEAPNVVDGDLATYSTFAQTAGGLAILDSVDESVVFPGTVPSGAYAVFGLSFPGGTVDASLLNQITVTTYNNDVKQETVSLTQNAIDLLGASVLGDKSLFLGMKTKKAFDTVTVGLSTSLLSANVGDAMYVHELCTDGDFVTLPTP